MVGDGKGSWQMRGQQLGLALGARVTGAPSRDDYAWADVVILVKRAGLPFAEAVHQAGKPLVWDALDFWRQPGDNHGDATQSRALLRTRIAAIRPALTLGATEAMAAACGGVYLPHHGWAGLEPTPARATVQTVAYQGNPVYLGAWTPALRAECHRRGWAFVINPPDLREADLLVALRDGPWNGWICREWKSGVKIVNAIAAGRPVITQDSAAVRELRPPGSVIEAPKDLSTVFEVWASQTNRAIVVDACRERAPAFTVQAVADRYRQILTTQGAPCAA
jgi:hypothetical protein